VSVKHTDLPSLTEGPIVPLLIRLSVPIVFANILQSAYQIVDTFWVGRLSAQAVAAVSLCFPVSFFLIAIGGGLPMAGAILIAQYKGKGDDDAVQHVAAQTMLFIFVIALFITSIGWFIAEPILSFMGAESDVLPDATRYLQFTFLGYIFVFGFFAYQSLMRGLGIVKFPMYIVLGTVILNLILDPLFIFGWGPIPGFGVSGAALATLFTQAFATLIAFVSLSTGQHGIHLRLKELRPDFPFMRQAFLIGLPASLEQSSRSMGMIAMTMLVASFGTTVVAAYGIGMRILMFVAMPAMGLSMATSTFVGQNIGAGKIKRAERTTLLASVLIFFVLISIAIVLYPFTPDLARFFMPEGGEAIAYSAHFMRIVLFAASLMGIAMVINGTFRGAGDMRSAMVFAFVSHWLLQLPLAYVLSKYTSLGFEGIWWSYLISDCIATVLVILWYLRGGWKKKELLSNVQLQRKARDETVMEEGILS